MAAAFDAMAPHDAAQAAIALSSSGNRYLAEVQPWTAFKKVRSI